MYDSKEATWLLQEKYGGEKTEGFFADLVALQNGTPLAYLIGYMPFLDCRIYLDSHPLIPRPETEYWTEKVIDTIRASTSPDTQLRILDLCAGSGAIGVAIAKALPHVHLTFAEIDATHLPTIRRNIKHNLPEEHWEKHTIVQSDLFTPMHTTKARSASLGMFDYIVSNPPYIDPEKNTADTSVVSNEPHNALYGGKNGMEYITRILHEAPAHLKASGQLWIEHEPTQVSALKALAQTRKLHVQTYPDQYSTLRYSVVTHNMAQ